MQAVFGIQDLADRLHGLLLEGLVLCVMADLALAVRGLFKGFEQCTRYNVIRMVFKEDITDEQILEGPAPDPLHERIIPMLEEALTEEGERILNEMDGLDEEQDD